ncbi:hypothetical protein [Sphingopyxis sp. LC363]|uniref:hypothetical protein n=2 Tax=unclassified Sphingopyxis TaxID=2614943 RepID=UPI001269DE79|nr:hypothetical protein [Sphingopyxis sp. LC363]
MSIMSWAKEEHARLAGRDRRQDDEEGSQGAQYQDNNEPRPDAAMPPHDEQDQRRDQVGLGAIVERPENESRISRSFLSERRPILRSHREVSNDEPAQRCNAQ